MTAYIRRQSIRGLAAEAVEALTSLRRHIPAHRGLLFGFIIILGLAAFETFNFSTTEFALGDLLGGLSFAGVRWATILALAFCSIDFAGIARLMTPEEEAGQPTEIWYLMGAWFLGATMNATLTWWSVSLALLEHNGLGNEILGRDALLSGVPIFIAGLVWLIRVLLIGTLTLAGHRLFSMRQSSRRPAPTRLRTKAKRQAPASAAGARRAAVRSERRPVPTRERFTHDRMAARSRSRR